MAASFTQCGYLKPRTHEQCTGESVTDDLTSIWLCIRHLAKAMELIQDQKRRMTRRAER